MDRYYVTLIEDFTAIVMENWLDKSKKKVSWPPRPFSKSKMQNMVPDFDWIEYSYKRVWGPYDLTTANKWERLTADVSTAEETDAIINKLDEPTGRGLRKRQPKKLTSDEESSADEDQPTLRTVFNVNEGRNQRKHSVIADSSTDGSEEERESQIISQLPTPPDTMRSASVGKSSTETNTKGKRTPGLLTKNQSKNALQSLERSNVDEEQMLSDNNESPNINNVECTVARSNNNDKDNRFVTVQDLQKLKKQILRFQARKNVNTEKSENDSNVQEDEISILPELPLDSVEQFEDLESLLKRDGNARKELRTKLAKIGGPHLMAFTNRCLERLMTNKLAVEYSWTGQSRGKDKKYTTLKFKGTAVSFALIKTIVYSRCSFTESDCIGYVKRWLNNGKARYQKESLLNNFESFSEEEGEQVVDEEF